MAKKSIKVEWNKASEILPHGNILEGIVVITMPTPRCMMYGQYEKDGKKLIGFHDLLDNGKIKEYSIKEWSYFPFNT